MDLHPYCELFPAMPADDLAKLAEDIRQNGLREPVVTFEDKILDGRNRERAAIMAEVEVEYKEYRGKDALAYVISRNLHRRHLTESQRAMVAARFANLRIGQTGDIVSSVNGSAEALRVSPRSVDSARTVETMGVTELREAVDAGAVSVSAAAEVAELPPDEQEEIIAAGPDAVVEKAKEHREEKRKAKAKPQPTRKRDVLQDALGKDVPNSLRDLFGDVWLTESAEGLGETLDRVKKTRKLTEKKSGAYGSFLKTETILKALASASVELETAQAMLTEGRPHAVCPKCGGEKCKTCRNAGWLPKYRYMELKSEGKL
jgi:hypothetical protein